MLSTIAFSIKNIYIAVDTGDDDEDTRLRYFMLEIAISVFSGLHMGEDVNWKDSFRMFN